MRGEQLPEHSGFSTSLKQEKIAFPRCRDCGRFHWYPKPVCPHCRSDSLEWQAVRGPAEVYSFTVVRHIFDDKIRQAVPYVVALLEFQDAPGVRLITNLVAIMPEAVRIGMIVEPVFPQTSGEAARVEFRPSTATA